MLRKETIFYRKYAKTLFGQGLAEIVSSHIIDYCIPRSEIKNAMTLYKANGSTSEIIRLEKNAKELFTHIDKSGEGGEILLSLLVEAFLGYPQIMSKMNLKTNTGLHYNGADGIHAGVDDMTGMLNLYWGESKLYGNFKAAVSACVKSLAPFLLQTYGSNCAQKRDIQLLRNYIDLDDKRLENAFKLYLDPQGPHFKKLKYCGVCLVGFDSLHYPYKANNATNDSVRRLLEAEVDMWKNSFKEHIESRNIETYTLHIFCLPFPSVEAFRKEFFLQLGIKK